MRFVQLFGLFALLPFSSAAETILGAYIYHRHGDRTAKVLPPVSLTDLGYLEVWQSGQYLRERYIDAAGAAPIAGISPDVVVQSQITFSTPDDLVLMNSAQGFIQGIYPPVGNGPLSTQTLRNTSVVQTPLDGYQLVPIHTVDAGAGSSSESSGWLQGATGCVNAEASSLEYYNTSGYRSLLSSTAQFYEGLTPVLNGTFTPAATSFQNAYTIFDLLNVANIHNASLNTNILTPDVLFQTRTLADIHEWNLAYNASSPVRAIAGATLAAQILAALNTTITSAGASKLNVQFGSYGTFFSFFGLAQLPAASPDFYGMPDYASWMSLELVTNASATPFPAPADISVRFLFHNGSAPLNASAGPTAYPLFGQQAAELPWPAFAEEMAKIAVGAQQAWCAACGSASAGCTAAPPPPSALAAGPRLSNSVAGVIGAMVTLGAVLAAAALLMVVGGFRLRKGGVPPVQTQMRGKDAEHSSIGSGAHLQ